MPNRWAKYLYKFLIPKAGTYGIFSELPDRLRAEFEFTGREWEGAYKGLTEPCQGAVPRLYHQPEDSLWFLREQFEEQVIKKGGASPNHLIGLQKTYENLPEGIIKQAFMEKYGEFVNEGIVEGLPRDGEGATPDPLPDPPPKGKERKGNNKLKETKTFLSENQNFSDEVVNLTNLLISKIKSNDLKAKTPPLSENGTQDPKWRKWARDADLLLRVDERPFKEAEQLVHWCQDSVFWRANIRSMAKFREQYPQLRLKWKAEQEWQPQEKETESDRIRRLTGG